MSANKHLMPNRYICGECGFEARSASGLSGHSQLTHGPGGSSHFRSGAIEERLTAIYELLTAVSARLDTIASTTEKSEKEGKEEALEKEKTERKKKSWREEFGEVFGV